MMPPDQGWHRLVLEEIESEILVGPLNTLRIQRDNFFSVHHRLFHHAGWGWGGQLLFLEHLHIKKPQSFRMIQTTMLMLEGSSRS